MAVSTIKKIKEPLVITIPKSTTKTITFEGTYSGLLTIRRTTGDGRALYFISGYQAGAVRNNVDFIAGLNTLVEINILESQYGISINNNNASNPITVTVMLYMGSCVE